MHLKITGAILAMVIFTPPSQAGFDRAGDTRAWCKERTLNYLRDHGYTPYNWTASTHLKDMHYITKGEWRLDVDDLEVECRSKKDGKRASGKFKILNIEIMDAAASAPRQTRR